jgi:hypothetical protein
MVKAPTTVCVTVTIIVHPSVKLTASHKEKLSRNMNIFLQQLKAKTVVTKDVLHVNVSVELFIA